MSETTSKKLKILALIILLISAFMDLIDTTIVNIALPSIQKELSTSTSAAQWTVDAYLIGMSIAIITGGRLGDIYGRKKIFLIGIAGFTVTSALSGFAPTIAVLIAARFLQGLTAAIMVPQVLSFIQVLFKPEERAGAIGAYSVVLGLATICGPLLSALLLSHNIFGLTWRPVFLINLPIGILTFIAAVVLLKESKEERVIHIDIIGIILVSIALVMFMYPLIEGYDLGWPIWTYTFMIIAVLVAAIFIFYERKRMEKGKSPLMALNIFKFKGFTGAVTVSALMNLALAGFILVFTFYLQEGLKFTPVHTALTALPFTIMAPAMASFAVIKLAPRFGRKVVTLGVILFAIGLVGIEVILNMGGTELNTLYLIPALLIAGAGMGMLVAPIADFALSEVPTKDAGSASGVYSMINQIGACIGVAFIGTMFFNSLNNSFSGFAAGGRLAVWLAAGIMILAIPCTFLLPKRVHKNIKDIERNV